jgi:hypothetical protein
LLGPLLLRVGKEIAEKLAVREGSKRPEEAVVELELCRTLQANMMNTFEKLQQTRRTLVCIRNCSEPLSAHVTEGDELLLN